MHGLPNVSFILSVEAGFFPLEVWRSAREGRSHSCLAYYSISDCFNILVGLYEDLKCVYRVPFVIFLLTKDQVLGRLSEIACSLYFQALQISSKLHSQHSILTISIVSELHKYSIIELVNCMKTEGKVNKEFSYFI